MAEFTVTGYSTWPPALVDIINRHADVFKPLTEEQEEAKKYDFKNAGADARRYDVAIAEIVGELRKHCVRGYHCSRLTEPEIVALRAKGMAVPDIGLLRSRIDTLEQEDLIPSALASRLREENQAADQFRRGLWFMFYNPSTLDQGDTERFFRSWGGEALYNSHEDDPETGPLLRQLGMPVLIEALVPLNDLHNITSLADKMAKFYHGALSREHADHEGPIDKALPAEALTAFHARSSAEFSQLTGCNAWDPPLAP